MTEVLVGWLDPDEAKAMQAEIDALRAELQLARFSNVVTCGNSHPEMYKTELDKAKETIEQLGFIADQRAMQIEDHQATIEQQAEAIRLKDESIDFAICKAGEVDRETRCAMLEKALSTKPSMDILKERDKRVAEACAKTADARCFIDSDAESSGNAAEDVRSGEWIKYL